MEFLGGLRCRFWIQKRRSNPSAVVFSVKSKSSTVAKVAGLVQPFFLATWNLKNGDRGFWWRIGEVESQDSPSLGRELARLLDLYMKARDTSKEEVM